MKSRLLSVALLAVAVMMTASAAFAAPVAQGTPFKGSWDSQEYPTFIPAPPPDAVTMLVDLDAWGAATHLGKYAAEFAATVDFAGCGCSEGDTIRFVAANGDILYGVGSAFGVAQADPSYHLVTHQFEITGGTGRFASATGSFTVTRLVHLPTGVSEGSFEGTIVLPLGN